MNTTHSQIVSFIWSIADDVLREWSKNDNPPIAHRRNHPAYRRSQRWTLASDTNVQKAIKRLFSSDKQTKKEHQLGALSVCKYSQSFFLLSISFTN